MTHAPIAQGSYGVVGSCIDEIDGSKVAIKKISVSQRYPNAPSPVSRLFARLVAPLPYGVRDPTHFPMSGCVKSFDDIQDVKRLLREVRSAPTYKIQQTTCRPSASRDRCLPLAAMSRHRCRCG